MVEPNAFENLDSLILSAIEVRELTGWPDPMVEDYLNILRNIVNTAEKADQIAIQVNTNSDNIEALDVRVTQNESLIADLTVRVDANELAIDNHINSDSEHGVNGVNVGTEDFCSSTVGGVVLLADLIADLSPIVTVDLNNAPVIYDQAYTQLVTDLTNENKAKINEIVSKINEIISGQKISKQMSN